MAHRVVLVQWEGRGYDASSWKADQAVIKNVVGNGVVYTCAYDVGMLFTNVDPRALCEPCELTTTRHGETFSATGPTLADALMEGAFDDIDGEEVKEAIEEATEDTKEEYWERYDSFADWVVHAIDQEILSV
jgi:hypothetical protein